MISKRLIVCLDVKGGRVVKGVKFRDLKDLGDPAELAARYEADGADEIVFLDISAAAEERATLLDLAQQTASRLFIPLTIGGGVRTADDVAAVLRAGADKVSLNTTAVERPDVIGTAAARFGAQCVVVSLDAAREDGSWRVFTRGGTTRTDLEAVSWAREAVGRGAGELLVTSIDRDGGRAGYDIPLVAEIAAAVDVPVIASGGAGSARHVVEALTKTEASAALVAGILHDGSTTVRDLKEAMIAAGNPDSENLVSELAALLQAVGEVAQLAGGVANQLFGTSVGIELKQDGSPVTIADRSAEQAARDWIARRFPEDAILGEEFGVGGVDGRRRWLIDPIDGTKSFVAGVPLWGTLIAVVEGDEVLAGAINCAAAGEMVVAARGLGCWLNGARCRVSDVGSLETATVLTTDDRFPDRPARRNGWAELARQARIVRTWGDCFGYLLVATGRAEVMVDDKMNPWDSACLMPIIEEAGGVLTDWRRGTTAFGGDTIATNAALDQSVRRLLVPE